MTIKEIFEKFEDIGCLTFATIDSNGYPSTRIAHFLAYDDQGLYFMTMNTKPFYRELIKTSKISVCGLYAKTQVESLENGNLHFDPGFSIRLSGDVREISINELKKKNNPMFKYCIEDNERYPSMTAFVIYNAKGEIYDYDFDKEKKDHKLDRIPFSFGNLSRLKRGLTITDRCIGCRKCEKICSFNAIAKINNKFSINPLRCDECGNCLINCPVNAIKVS